jgi:hypothetical protein
MMNGVTKEDVRSILHLVSIGVVGAATVGIFFGLGFMWLTDPRPAAPPGNPAMPGQALEADAISAPLIESAASAASPVLPAEKVAASPNPDPRADGALVTLNSAAIDATLIRPDRITHSKGLRNSRRRLQGTVRYRAASWRPDASAGPNPGGGFYGPPNSNIGYINPR